MRLDHLLSRVSEPDPYDKIGAPIVLPFAVKGAGSKQGKSRFLSLLSCQGEDPGLVAQLVRAQS